MASTMEGMMTFSEPMTKNSSVTLMKKVTGAAVSHIAYARNLFEESDFDSRSFGGINIKVIKRSAQTGKDVCALHGMLEGAFDAITKGYLKSMSMEIVGSDGHLFEAYDFLYSYNNEEVTCEILSGSAPSVHFDVNGSVRNLLRNILVMTSYLQRLPQNCRVGMKLTYYDNIPEDYEPAGFKPFYGTQPTFKDTNNSKYWCGTVTSKFHTLKVKCRQVIANKENQPTGEVSQTICCVCEMTDKASCMIKCSNCSTSQHAACYKFLYEEASEKFHVCFNCENMTHDTSNDFQQVECIFRRILAECLKLKTISIRKLMSLIQLSPDKVILNMRRLQREGVLCKTPQPFTMEKPDFAYTIVQKCAENLKLKYFKG